MVMVVVLRILSMISAAVSQAFLVGYLTNTSGVPSEFHLGRFRQVRAHLQVAIALMSLAISAYCYTNCCMFVFTGPISPIDPCKVCEPSKLTVSTMHESQ